MTLSSISIEYANERPERAALRSADGANAARTARRALDARGRAARPAESARGGAAVLRRRVASGPRRRPGTKPSLNGAPMATVATEQHQPARVDARALTRRLGEPDRARPPVRGAGRAQPPASRSSWRARWCACTRSSSRPPRASRRPPGGPRAPMPRRGLVVLQRPPADRDHPGVGDPRPGSCASWSRPGNADQARDRRAGRHGRDQRRGAAPLTGTGRRPPDGSSTGACTRRGRRRRSRSRRPAGSHRRSASRRARCAGYEREPASLEGEQ